MTPEAQARRLARDVALLLQAALLFRQVPSAASGAGFGAVFGAFCDSRLADACDVFGLLGAAHDLDTLISRAMPTETP